MSFTVMDEPLDRPEFLREALRLIATRVERGREQLLARVAVTSDAALAAGTDEDWGLGQVAAHLLIVERGISGIALRLAQGMPPGATGQPRPAVGAYDRAKILELAEKAKERLQRLLAEFPSEPDTRAVARQPFYGEMNCWGWLLASRLHYEAHLEALERGTKTAL